MDVRALLCFWLTKPVAYDTGGHNVCIMKQSMYHSDSFNSGKSTRRWGDCYSPLDTWIDLDRRIKNDLDYRDYTTVTIYLKAMVDINGYDWERWKALPHYIQEELRVIAYDIMQEGREEDETS